MTNPPGVPLVTFLTTQDWVREACQTSTPSPCAVCNSARAHPSLCGNLRFSIAQHALCLASESTATLTITPSQLHLSLKTPPNCFILKAHTLRQSPHLQNDSLYVHFPFVDLILQNVNTVAFAPFLDALHLLQRSSTTPFTSSFATRLARAEINPLRVSFDSFVSQGVELVMPLVFPYDKQMANHTSFVSSFVTHEATREACLRQMHGWMYFATRNINKEEIMLPRDNNK